MRRKNKNNYENRNKIEKTKMKMPHTNEYQDRYFEDHKQYDTDHRKDTVQSGLKNNKDVKINYVVFWVCFFGICQFSKIRGKGH